MKIETTASVHHSRLLKASTAVSYVQVPKPEILGFLHPSEEKLDS